MGVPWASASDQIKLDLGNACLRATLKLVRYLHRRGIPWIWENPDSSKMWDVSDVKEIAAMQGVRTVVADFCRFKKPWRKRTRFLCGNIDELDLSRLDKRCQGSRGICSSTGKPHFQLSGSSPSGIPWTRIAQPYPTGLCHALAFALTAKARARYYHV